MKQYRSRIKFRQAKLTRKREVARRYQRQHQTTYTVKMMHANTNDNWWREVGNKMPEHSSKAFQGMNERRKKGELCDFEIRVERKKFSVHRLVLDTCSEYFRTMFTSGMQESVQGFCEFNEVEAEVVETCIEFMYTGEMDITADLAVSVLQLAHMWQLNTAVKICERILCVNLNTECCFLYRRLASLYGLKNLSSRCTDLIFSEIEIVKYSSEIEDFTSSEIKSLLHEWKQYCNERFMVSFPIPSSYWHWGLILVQSQMIYRHQSKETKESNVEFWKLCNKWSEFKNNSRHFCQIVECFQIKILLLDDFLNTVIEDKHVKECEKCKQSVCQRYLGDAVETSDENCLILKDLANRYNCKNVKKQLACYIMQKYKTISKRPEFNALVPPEDFIAYMKCCEYWECSEKLSIIASWIRFSPDREETFPKLFKDKQLKSTDFESLREMQDALLIKTLSRKYSCKKVHEAALQFIIPNFLSIIKLPEFLTIDSMDLISYLQNLKSYGEVPEEIWHSIIRWVYHNFEQREEEFSKVFQALHLKMFSFTFVQKTICRFALVRKSCECMSRLLDFILHEQTTNPIRLIQNVWTKLRDIFKREIEPDGDLAILPLIYNSAFRRMPSDE